MINQPPPELFPQRPVRSEFSRRRARSGMRFIVVGFIFLVLAGGLGLYVKLTGQEESKPTEIPTIKAEGPLKQRPEEPGGINIPHQDVLVFQQIDANEADKTPVEHLLPPPETPQPVTAEPASSTQNAGATTAQSPPTSSQSSSPQSPLPAMSALTPDGIAKVPTTVIEQAIPAPPPTINSAASANLPPTNLSPPTNSSSHSVLASNAQVSNASASNTAQANPSPTGVAAINSAATDVTQYPASQGASQPASQGAPPSAAPKAQISSTTPKTMHNGSHIQLASLIDQVAATTEKQRLEVKYAALLGKAKLHVKKADLGAKGVYYRIETSSLSDAQAVSICASLKSMKAGCMIVRP